jgi:iron(III) transport system substrate-binding protein
MVVLMLSPILAGCVGPQTEARVQSPGAVSEGGTLTVLGSAEEEYVRGVVRAFEVETGIKTNYVRRSTGDALQILRDNRGAPEFSVWWGGPADAYIAAANDGLLDAYRPHGSAKIPNRYKDPEGQWTGVYVGALAFAVNTRVLQREGLPEPTSWEDLIKPAYRSHISIAHPATSGTAYTMLSTVIQLNNKDTLKGFDYFKALHNNVQEYQRSGAMPARLAGRGEPAVGISFSHDIVAAVEDGLTDLKVVFPSEGTGYEVGAMALVKNAPQPELGRRFMDWAVSEEAQEMGPIFTAYQIPTNPDAKVPQKSAKLSSIKMIDYDFAWSGASREALVTRFTTSIMPPPMQINVAPQNR